MTDQIPSAYCFFQDLTPRPPLDAVFDRDYLLYAVSGALRVTVGEQVWLLPPSFAAFVPAETPFRVEIHNPLTTCSVLARRGFCKNLPARPKAFQMSEMTRHMIRYCREWGADATHPAEAEGFFLALLNACAELAETSVNMARPHAFNPALMKAIDLTESLLSDPVRADEIARAVGLSERTMQRKFSALVGMSWSQALTRLRMIRALELLSLEESSIIQIAGDCGYSSLSAFNRAFLEFTNQTPSAFRQGLRR